MERPPPRSASRTDLSGLRALPPPTLASQVKRELTPRRLALAGATVALGGFAALLLDTHFPESIVASAAPEARRAASELLEAAAREHGTMEQWRERGVVEARVRDEWHGMFSALSVWGKSSVSLDVAMRPDGDRHLVRMDLGDLRWGYDGAPWIDGAESTAADRLRVERVSYALSQLLLLPFSAITAGTAAERIAPGVISIRFRRHGAKERTEEWRLYLDEASARITHVVLPLTIADPSPLTRCDIVRWSTVEGITLPSELKCSLANRLELGLHDLTVLAIDFRSPTPGIFSAPGTTGAAP